MIGWLLLGIFLSFLFWLLWTPLCINIDSAAGLARLEWRGICRLQWLPEQGVDRLYLQVFFFRRQIQLSKPAAKTAQPTKTVPVKKQPSGKPLSIRKMGRLIRNILQSFQVKRCYLLWDSGDFIWNARWYPLAWQLSRLGKGTIEVNFMGQRELTLLVENRLGRLIWAALKTFTTK